MMRCVMVAGVAISSLAMADLQITEVYIGINGEDGTSDWVELTNFGDSAVSLGGLFYDDESADIGAGGGLPNVVLGAGESIVILVDANPGTEAAAIAEFEAVWGTGINVVAVDGGGLGQGGDVAFILDSVGGLVDFVNTPATLGSELATLQFDAEGNFAFSTLGANGAFASNLFFNDNLGAPNNEIFLIGSPGVIPAPATVALLGLGGLVGGRRRR